MKITSWVQPSSSMLFGAAKQRITFCTILNIFRKQKIQDPFTKKLEGE